MRRFALMIRLGPLRPRRLACAVVLVSACSPDPDLPGGEGPDSVLTAGGTQESSDGVGPEPGDGDASGDVDGDGDEDTSGDGEGDGDGEEGGSAIHVAAGGGHTCVLLSGGTVRCWGSGMAGQLGYGNTETIGDDETPRGVGDVDLEGTVVQVVAGDGHTCARLDTERMYCWGAGSYGRLGYGDTDNIGDDETPTVEVPLGGNQQLAAGSFHTCARGDSGGMRCWGRGQHGQLGYGNTDDIGDDEALLSAGKVDIGLDVVYVATGARTTCAIRAGGALRCWGEGDFGKLGYGNTETIGDDETAGSVGDVDVGGSVVAVAPGGEHTCALLDTGAVRCWGMGANGRLGYGSTETIGDDETPATAGDVDVGGPVLQVVTGSSHTCALLDTGNVRCWGPGYMGQLGYGKQAGCHACSDDPDCCIGDDEAPRRAGDVDVGGKVVQISASRSHTCARLESGAIRCWGHGAWGELGYGNLAVECNVCSDHPTCCIGDDETPASAGDVRYE